MESVRTIEELRTIINKKKKEGKKIGFVPTMGFLHDGHLSLIEISKKHSDFQVMSIFVNKIQFNDKSDYENYPREIERDLKLARGAGIDVVFLPDDSEMYNNRLTYVDMMTLTDNLCGAHRPGHFKGVFTVVAKLFNIVQPDVSVFGQKDIQQAISIEKMVFDLNFPIKIIIAPTIREKEGLAMSSRNKHLSNDERKRALCIYESLKAAEELIASGEINVSVIISEIKKIINKGKPEKVDYISITSYDDLQPVDRIEGKSVIAVAAFYGSTRLIDNMIVERIGKDFKCIY